MSKIARLKSTPPPARSPSPEARNSAANRDRRLASLGAPTVAVFALFFLSGAAGLVYQVVWSRLLTEVFGVTLHAVTAVLTTFLAGLAAGAVLLGKVGDRSTRPLRLYGWLEIGIGAAAIGGAALLRAVEPLHVMAANQFPASSPALLAIRFGLACLVVLPATSLMGGTLPVITRAMVTDIAGLGRRLSALYALNTAGAVVGCLAAGFVLIRSFGLRATLLGTVAANVLVGLVAWQLSRRTHATGTRGQAADSAHRPDGPLESSGKPAREAGADAASRQSSRGLLLVMGLSGFSSLGFEVVWTRALVLVVDSSAYAFVTMLAAFLVGITLGSAAVRPLVDRVRQPRSFFGWLQVGIAASAMASIPLIAAFDPGTTLQWMEDLTQNPAAAVAARFGMCFLLMLVPTTLIGATFPVAGRIWARQLGSIGSDLGQVYGANTLGNILGAALTGFLLLPLLGLQKSLALLVAFNVVCAAWGLLAGSGQRPLARIARTVVVGMAAAAILGILAIWQPPPFRMAFEHPRDRLLFYREGSLGTVKVIQKQEDASRRMMGVDAIKIAESGGGVDEKQQVLAHLPFLLSIHNPPKTVLSIGLGSGILIGEIGRHESVERIECVELSEAVIEGARHFDGFNHGILNDPRARIIADDGVNYLRRSTSRYDAISSDAKSRSGHSGNAVFFSREYYEYCRDHLSATGLMIQWVPMIEPPGDMSVIARTFADVFPHVSVWATPPYSVYMVGGTSPAKPELERIAGELEKPAYEGLKRHGWADAASLAALYICDEQSVESVLGPGPVNTLDRPLLEYYSFADYATPPDNRLRKNMELLRRLRRPPAWIDLTADVNLAAAYEAGGILFDATFALIGVREGGDNAGLRQVERALQTAPDCAGIRYAAADAYVHAGGRGNRRLLMERLARALELWPNSPDALAWLGAAELAEGKLEQAAAHLAEAIRLNPGLKDARKKAAQVHTRLGQFEQAQACLKAALEIDPQDVEANYLMGRNLAAQKRYGDAIAAYRDVLRTQPEYAEAHLSLGIALANAGQVADAVPHFKEALRINPKLQGARAALDRALRSEPSPGSGTGATIDEP